MKNYVLADNQPSVDPITTLNAQINEIDKKLMENSQSWNEMNMNKISLEAKMNDRQRENSKMRAEKEKLIADKESLIL
jgi:hypothetical protein